MQEYSENRQLVRTVALRRFVLTLIVVTTVAGFSSILFLIAFNIHLILTKAHVFYHYDFGFFYWAFKLVWDHQSPTLLYNRPLQSIWMVSLGYPNYGINQYVYPPQFAFMFSWLAVFPFTIAKNVWAILSLGGYAVGGFLMLGLAYRGRSILARVFLLSVMVANYGYFSDLTLGNANWLIYLTLALFVDFRYRRDWRFWAGVALGLAILIKVTPGVLVLYYVIRRDVRTILGAIVGILVPTLATLPVLGWTTMWNYARSLSGMAALSMDNGPAPYNSSVKGVLMWLSRDHIFHLSMHTINVLFMAYVLLLGIFIVLVMCQGVRENRREASLAVSCVTMFSPLLEGTHMVTMLIPLLMVLGSWWEEHMGNENDGHRARSQLTLTSVGWFLIALVAVVGLTSIGEMLPFIARHSFALIQFTGYVALITLVIVQFVRAPLVHSTDGIEA